MIRKVMLIAMVVAASLTLGADGAVEAQSVKQRQASSMKAYKKAEVQYNLGNWDAAIKYYKAAFEIYAHPNYLLNIGQSYRQNNRCKKSIFFYRRYLSMVPESKFREEIEGRIVELQEQCQEEGEDDDDDEDMPKRQRTKRATRVRSASNEKPTKAEVDVKKKPPTEEAGSLLTIHASVGPTLFFIGDTTSQLNFTLGAGYPIPLQAMTLDVGVSLSYSRIKWVGNTPMIAGTSGFTAILANLGADIPITSKLLARTEVGIGTMIYSGLDEKGNIFADQTQQIEGTFAVFSFRVAAGIEYKLTEQIALSVHPLIFSYSQRAQAMVKEISSVTAIQAIFGLAYRM